MCVFVCDLPSVRPRKPTGWGVHVGAFPCKVSPGALSPFTASLAKELGGLRLLGVRRSGLL